MKKHEVRHLEGLLESLCADLKHNHYALQNLETLLLGCIDLARTGNAWRATSIALEASSYMARMFYDINRELTLAKGSLRAERSLNDEKDEQS